MGYTTFSDTPNWWFFFGLQHLDHRHVASPIFTHRNDEINQQNDDAIWCNQEQVDMLGGYPFWTGNVGALVTKMLRLGLHTRLTPLASTNHRQVLGVETGTYCKYESGCVWKWSTVYPPVAVLMGNMMSPFICPHPIKHITKSLMYAVNIIKWPWILIHPHVSGVSSHVSQKPQGIASTAWPRPSCCPTVRSQMPRARSQRSASGFRWKIPLKMEDQWGYCSPIKNMDPPREFENFCF